MEQVSRLSIVIDTKNAEQQIKSLKAELGGISKSAKSAADGLGALNKTKDLPKMLSDATKKAKAFHASLKAVDGKNLNSTKNAVNALSSAMERLGKHSKGNLTKTLSTALKDGNKYADGFGKSIDKAAQSLGLFVQNSHKAASAVQKLNSSLKQAGFAGFAKDVSKTKKELDGIVGTLPKVKGATEALADSNKKASKETHVLEKAYSTLKSAMAGFMAFNALHSVLATSDAMQTLSSQIRVATKSSEEHAAAMQAVREIANANGTALSAVGELYTANTRALSQLGKSQVEIVQFTSNLTRAMAVGGGSAEGQAAAIVQLGQALASGALRGDEFNSVSEQAPEIMSLLASHLKVTTGELKEMASKGKITASVLYDAVANATDELAEKFGKMPFTIAQSRQVLKNEWDMMVGEFMNGTSGISSAISQAILAIGTNLQSIVTIGAGAAVVFGGQYAASMLAAKLGVSSLTGALVGKASALATSTAQNIADAYSQKTLTAATVQLTAAKSALSSVTSALSSVTGAAVWTGLEFWAMTHKTTTGVLAWTRSTLTLSNAKAVLSTAISTSVATVNGWRMATASAVSSGIAYAKSLTTVSGAKQAMATAGTLAVRGIMATASAMKTASVASVTYTARLVTANATKRAMVGTATLLGRGITTLGGAFKSVGAIIMAHPLMMIGGIIATIAVRTMGLEKAMESLSDAFGVAAELLGQLVDWGIKGFDSLWGAAGDFLSSFGIGSKDTCGSASSYFGEMFAGTKGGFVGVMQVAASVLDRMIGAVYGFTDYAITGFVNFGTRVKNVFVDIAQTIEGFFNGLINGAISQLNGVIGTINAGRALLGWDPINTISEVNVTAGLTKGQIINNQYVNNYNGNFLRNKMDGAIEINETKKEQQAKLNNQGGGGSVGSGSNDKDGKGGKKDGKGGKGGKKDGKGGKGGSKSLLKAEVAKAILWGANELGIDPNHLASVISFETGGTFSTNARNPGSSATGLIQFMEDADGKKDDKYYGMTRDQFGALSHMEQMKYVVQFFRAKGLKAGASIGDVYDAVTGYGYRAGTKAYNQNKVWDANKDGYIAKGESVKSGAFKAHMKNFFPNGGNMQDLGEAMTEQAKLAIEQARKEREQAAVRLGIVQSFYSERAKLDDEYLAKHEAITNAGFGEMTQHYLDLAKEEYQTKLGLWELEQDRKMQAATEWQQSEEERIRANAELERRAVMLTAEMSQELRTASIEKINHAEMMALEQVARAYQAELENLTQDSRSELENLLLSYERKRDEINSRTDLSSTQKLEMIEAVNANQNQSVFKLQEDKRNQVSGLWHEIMGTSELNQIDVQMRNRKEIIDEALKNEVISWQEHQTMMQAINEQAGRARNNMVLDQMGEMAGNMTSIMGNIVGENSKAYRAMFAMEKGFAIAKAIIAMNNAIANGGMSLPFPANLGAMATIASNMAGIVANIRAVQMPIGQAHDGIMSVPKSGTWNLEKGERVLPRHTAKALDAKLDSMGSGGGRAVNVTVHNYSGEPTKVETDANGDIRLIVGEELNKQLPQHVNNPNSEFNRSLKNNYQLQRRL